MGREHYKELLCFGEYCQRVVSFDYAGSDLLTFRILQPFLSKDIARNYSIFGFSLI